MKTRLLAALLALPLLAFDCGGEEEEEEVSPFGMDCKLEIRGAASEDLWCIVAAFDYADLDPQNTMWAFELAAYRGMTEVGAGVGIFHDGRPALGTAYGWSELGSNVDSGSASRMVGDLAADPPSSELTHEAWAPMTVGDAVGALSVTFTRIPPPGATVGAGAIDVHGTLTGTLEPVDPAGAPVTFRATF
jgi:hypothetical protein